MAIVVVALGVSLLQATTSAHSDPSAGTSVVPDGPHGGRLGSPVVGGWQDGRSQLTVLNLATRFTGTLDNRSLYRLVRGSAETVAQVTAVSAATTPFGSPFFWSTSVAGSANTVALQSVPSENSGWGLLLWNGQPVIAAAFVYDGTVPKILVEDYAKELAMFPTTLKLGGSEVSADGTHITTIPAIDAVHFFGMYLGYQNAPSKWISAPAAPSLLDPRVVYKTSDAGQRSSTSIASGDDCEFSCFAVAAKGHAPAATLSVAPGIGLITINGTTTKFTTAALAYSSAGTDKPALMAVPIGNAVMTFASTDPAGRALLEDIYTPLHGPRTAGAPLNSPEVAKHGVGALWDPTVDESTKAADVPIYISTLEYDYRQSSHQSVAGYAVKDTYTDAEKQTSAIPWVPVRTDDPLTRLETGATAYEFGPAASPVNMSAIPAGTTAVATGLLIGTDQLWHTVMAFQVGAAPNATIQFLDLSDAANATAYADGLREMSGQADWTHSSPILGDRQLTFTDTRDLAHVVTPASAMTLGGYNSDGTSAVTINGAVRLWGQFSTTLSNETASSYGYGYYSQVDSSGKPTATTPIVAVRTASGTMLFDVFAGLGGGTETIMANVFGADHATAALIAQANNAALVDQTRIYQLASSTGNGLSSVKKGLAVATTASAIMASGEKFTFSTGANYLNPGLAKQLFDQDAVAKAASDAASDAGVTDDQQQLWAEQATLQDWYDNASSTYVPAVSGKIQTLLTSQAPTVSVPSFDKSPAGRLRELRALLVVRAFTDEAAAYDAVANFGDLTAALGTDYDTAMDLLAQPDVLGGAATATEQRQAVADAFEWLGISNDQIQAYATTAGCNGETRCVGNANTLLGYAIAAREAVTPARARKSTCDHDADALSVASLCLSTSYDPGTEANKGRWVFQHAAMDVSAMLADRAAQLADRAIYYQFPAWAKNVANTASLVAQAQSDSSVAHALVDDLQPTLASRIAAGGINDATVDQLAQFTWGDLTQQQLQWAWHSTLAVTMMILSLVAKLTATTADQAKLAELADNQLRYYNSQLNVMPNLTAEEKVDAFGDPNVDLISHLDPDIRSTLTKLGLVHTMGGLFALAAALSVGLDGFEPTPDEILQLAYSSSAALATAGHASVAIGLLATGKAPGFPHNVGMDVAMSLYDLWPKQVLTMVRRGDLVSVDAAATKYVYAEQMFSTQLQTRSTTATELLETPEWVEQLRATGDGIWYTSPADYSSDSTEASRDSIEESYLSARAKTKANKFDASEATSEDSDYAMRASASSSGDTNASEPLKGDNSDDVVKDVSSEVGSAPEEVIVEMLNPEDRDGDRFDRAASRILTDEESVSSEVGQTISQDVEAQVVERKRPAQMEDLSSFFRMGRADRDATMAMSLSNLKSALAIFTSQFPQRAPLLAKSSVMQQRYYWLGFLSEEDMTDAARQAMTEHLRLVGPPGAAEIVRRAGDLASMNNATEPSSEATEEASLYGDGETPPPSEEHTPGALSTIESGQVTEKVVALGGSILSRVISSSTRVLDLATSILGMEMGIGQLVEDHDSAAVIASGVAMTVGSASTLVGTLMQMLSKGTLQIVGTAFIVVGLLLTVISFVLEFFIKRNPAKDNDALSSWLAPFLSAGLVRGGQAGQNALLYWHDHNVWQQVLPSDCSDTKVSCTAPKTYLPPGERTVFRLHGTSSCLTVGSASDATSALLMSQCNEGASQQFAQLRMAGDDGTRLATSDGVCVDNLDGKTADKSPVAGRKCKNGDANQKLTLVAESDGGPSDIRFGGDASNVDCVTTSSDGLVRRPCGQSNQSWDLIDIPAPAN